MDLNNGLFHLLIRKKDFTKQLPMIEVFSAKSHLIKKQKVSWIANLCVKTKHNESEPS